jgi:hypothetical protein
VHENGFWVHRGQIQIFLNNLLRVLFLKDRESDFTFTIANAQFNFIMILGTELNLVSLKLPIILIISGNLACVRYFVKCIY